MMAALSLTDHPEVAFVVLIAALVFNAFALAALTFLMFGVRRVLTALEAVAVDVEHQTRATRQALANLATVLEKQLQLRGLLQAIGEQQQEVRERGSQDGD